VNGGLGSDDEGEENAKEILSSLFLLSLFFVVG